MMVTSFLTRSLIFIVLIMVWYFNVLLVAMPLTLWYIYNFRAYELIVLGVIIDLYFWSPAIMPYYTAAFLFTVIGMELLKPRLRRNDML